MIEDWQSGGFGLYVHWPYCEAKCPYCDFNSHVRREIDHARWRRAYLSEIARYRAKVPERLLNSIFFGGGTPSLMAPETVAAVIEEARAAWPVANDLEVTLEANPGSVEAQRFAAYADAGVNRVSMGVQALKDVDLRRLGRLHTAAEARRAFDVARKLFDRISFDLIYARQDQTVADWQCELKEALTMAVDHLSLYQLTIEPGTVFGERFSRGMLRGLPDDDRSAEMYETTQEACLQAGLPAYEISNHARPGAESRHNLIYWRYGDYVGIGPGAHGRITARGTRYATETWSNPDLWLDKVERGAAEKVVEPLSSHSQLCEFLLMGLRLDEGVEIARLKRLAGDAEPTAAIAHLRSMGMLELKDDRLRATASGRMVLNSVLKMLLD